MDFNKIPKLLSESVSIGFSKIGFFFGFAAGANQTAFVIPPEVAKKSSRCSRKRWGSMRANLAQSISRITKPASKAPSNRGEPVVPAFFMSYALAFITHADNFKIASD